VITVDDHVGHVHTVLGVLSGKYLHQRPHYDSWGNKATVRSLCLRPRNELELLEMKNDSWPFLGIAGHTTLATRKGASREFCASATTKYR